MPTVETEAEEATTMTTAASEAAKVMVLSVFPVKDSPLKTTPMPAPPHDSTTGTEALAVRTPPREPVLVQELTLAPLVKRPESNSTIRPDGSSWAEATQKKKQRARRTENLAIMRFKGKRDRKEKRK